MRHARIALGLALALAPLPALGQGLGPCMARGDFLRQLGARYGETTVARGLTGDGRVIEVIAAADGATWSIVLTMPSGLSCGVYAGEAWERVETPVPAGPPA